MKYTDGTWGTAPPEGWWSKEGDLAIVSDTNRGNILIGHACLLWNKDAQEQQGNQLLFAAALDLYRACMLTQEAEEHYRTCEDCDQNEGDFCEEALRLFEIAEAARKDAIAKAEGRL